MSDSTKYPRSIALRRFRAKQELIDEGILEDVPVDVWTQADWNQVNSRVLLNDIASAEGISVDQLFDNWAEELKTTKAYATVEDFLAALRGEPVKASRDGS